jgi:hypothetical protein
MQFMQAFVYLFLFLLAISAAIAVLTMIAPVALFALKAGLLPVPKKIRSGHWSSESAWLWAGSISGAMTILGFFGAFWVGLMVVNGWPDGQQAYVARYGPPGCRYWDRTDRCLFGSVGNVIKADALPFFVATTILLYARAASVYARICNKSIWPFLVPALVGALVFFVAIHIGAWLMVVSRVGVAGLIDQILNAAWHEVTSPYTFLMAALGNTRGGVETLISDEFIRLGGSFYKLASLYPKVLFVLLVGGLAHYLIAQPS